MITKQELREMATEVENDLIKNGDPFRGDDWSTMQVVRAYLNDHPPDEDLPVDSSWLNHVGIDGDFDPVQCLIEKMERGYEGLEEGELNKAFPTRGEFRRLCQVVGKELK